MYTIKSGGAVGGGGEFGFVAAAVGAALVVGRTLQQRGLLHGFGGEVHGLGGEAEDVDGEHQAVGEGVEVGGQPLPPRPGQFELERHRHAHQEQQAGQVGDGGHPEEESELPQGLRTCTFRIDTLFSHSSYLLTALERCRPRSTCSTTAHPTSTAPTPWQPSASTSRPARPSPNPPAASAHPTKQEQASSQQPSSAGRPHLRWCCTSASVDCLVRISPVSNQQSPRRKMVAAQTVITQRLMAMKRQMLGSVPPSRQESWQLCSPTSSNATNDTQQQKRGRNLRPLRSDFASLPPPSSTSSTQTASWIDVSTTCSCKSTTPISIYKHTSHTTTRSHPVPPQLTHSTLPTLITTNSFPSFPPTPSLLSPQLPPFFPPTPSLPPLPPPSPSPSWFNMDDAIQSGCCSFRISSSRNLLRLKMVLARCSRLISFSISSCLLISSYRPHSPSSPTPPRSLGPPTSDSASLVSDFSRRHSCSTSRMVDWVGMGLRGLVLLGRGREQAESLVLARCSMRVRMAIFLASFLRWRSSSGEARRGWEGAGCRSQGARFLAGRMTFLLTISRDVAQTQQGVLHAPRTAQLAQDPPAGGTGALPQRHRRQHGLPARPRHDLRRPPGHRGLQAHAVPLPQGRGPRRDQRGGLPARGEGAPRRRNPHGDGDPAPAEHREVGGDAGAGERTQQPARGVRAGEGEGAGRGRGEGRPHGVLPEAAGGGLLPRPRLLQQDRPHPRAEGRTLQLPEFGQRDGPADEDRGAAGGARGSGEQGGEDGGAGGGGGGRGGPAAADLPLGGGGADGGAPGGLRLHDLLGRVAGLGHHRAPHLLRLHPLRPARLALLPPPQDRPLPALHPRPLPHPRPLAAPPHPPAGPARQTPAGRAGAEGGGDQTQTGQEQARPLLHPPQLPRLIPKLLLPFAGRNIIHFHLAMNRYSQKPADARRQPTERGSVERGSAERERGSAEREREGESGREKSSSVVDMLGRLGTTDSVRESTPPQARRQQSGTTVSQLSTGLQRQQSKSGQQVEEDLLLSSHSLAGEWQSPSGPLVCPIHNKNLDILCKIQKVKICAHCALFGSHKDHTFQQESDFLEELRRKEAQLGEQRAGWQTLQRNEYLEEQWRSLELQIAEREDQQLAELHQEYANLVRMVASIKEEIEQQIKLQYAAATRAFREQADACKREMQYSRGFDRWSAEGRELLANLRGHFHSEKFNSHYRDYENFAWRQGELLLKDMQQSVERVKLTAKKTLSELRTTSQAPLLAHLANSLQLSQAHSNSQLDTSLTSLDDFSRTLFSHQDPSQNEFIESQQMPKHRNSDCLEKVLSPIAEAGSRLGSAKLVKPQNKLNSSILSPEPRKKENNPLSHSMVNTTLQRVKSSSRMESSMISPKNKSRAYRSSDAVRPKPDPLRVVKDYEKKAELLELNLSDCELTDESLVYFLERALNSHTPSSLNLERNQLSMGGIYKFMPYVVKCRSVNLSKTGLGEGCLDWLLKMKTPFVMEELNLAGNGISRQRNRPKLQQLLRNGLRIRIE